MNKSIKILILVISLIIIHRCGLFYGSTGEDGNYFTFIRQDNAKYITKVEGTILCGKRAIQDWCEREPEFPDIYTVYSYANIIDDDIDTALILAFDKNKDGYYETIYIDGNGNGDLDIRLQGRHLSTREIKGYFCKYTRLHTD